MKAIIIGGGVGGLTAALMLRARGLDCEVFEQADSIRELGVGINTLPHAIRELAGIGLLDRLDEVAIRTAELFYLTRHGQQVWHEKRGLDAPAWTLARVEPAGARQLSGVLGLQYRQLPDGEFNHSSELILLDADGRIVARTSHIGRLDPAFVEAIRRQLGGT